MDLDVIGSRAESSHHSHCPDIGPICQVRDEPPQQHHTTLYLTDIRVIAEYGLVKNLAVQAMLPFRVVGTRTTFSDLAGNPVTLDYSNIHHRNEVLVGLGDAQLFLHAATALGGFKLGGRFGVSVPFGRVSENPFRLGDMGLPHQHVQLGTGTFDPLLGLDVSRDFTRFALAAFGFAQAPLYAGGTGYQAGTRLAGGLVASSTFGLTRPTFRLGVLALHEFAERWDGRVPEEDGNLGRTDLFVGLGVTVPLASDWSVNFDVRGRVWGHVVGGQLQMPVVLEVSVGRLFHLESGEHEDADEGEDEHAAPAGDVADLVHQGELAPLDGVEGKWTVFDFWAPWCEACKTLDKDLRALARGDARVAVRRVNIVDFESPIAVRELPGATVLPRVRLVSPDGQRVLEESGTPEELLQKLNQALGAGASYRCPMHPHVVQPAPGRCPECGMALVPRAR